MRYLSDKTNKVYNTLEDLEKAEKEFDARIKEEKKKKEVRANRAKEVEDAYNSYKKLLEAFIKDYGSYHTSLTEGETFFDYIFNHFPF